MIAFAIFVSWGFVVSCACVLGANKELAAEQRTVAYQRSRLDENRIQYRQAMDRIRALVSYLDINREYRDFDETMRKLPKDGRHFYRGNRLLLEQRRFELLAARLATDPVPHDVAITTLAFDPWPLVIRGTEVVAWERRGWVLVPKDAFAR